MKRNECNADRHGLSDFNGLVNAMLPKPNRCDKGKPCPPNAQNPALNECCNHGSGRSLQHEVHMHCIIGEFHALRGLGE